MLTVYAINGNMFRVYTKVLGKYVPTPYTLVYQPDGQYYQIWLHDIPICISRDNITENMALSWLLENRY